MMWFIPKNRKAIFSLTAGLCLSLGFMAGCKESAPPAKPVVVKKRIEQTPQATVTEAEKATPKATSAAQAASETATPKGEKAAAPVAETAPVQPSKEAREKTAAPEAETVPSEAAAVAETLAGEGVPGETAEETELVSLKDSLFDTTFPKYDPTGKIDPFAALFSKESDTGLSDDTEPDRPLTPLEKIDISQLKLVAVVLAETGDRAMVVDATGKPYILTLGTYIGINSGTVTKILKDRVVIEEKTKDLLGRVKANTRELKKPFGEN